ncbi:MAG: cobyrinate a,c-diamide synthase [Pseudotabrizicola sp.]|uniref:cobyrinate a,c-diamide synthase n=1 Tax=Pseudotabrizicola sp. TaxID=2939647 RepID=UPI00271D1459|nr:cobyrinate a,c-diamide synthase [Pseudotabrizicola sp.]MDO9638430.1 cobyrinate a,c-diamide synthase [Pseudotabrizicola sp.]
MTPQQFPPGLMIAAPASGAGKTTVTLGLARALCDRGLSVHCFKSGPDYIDPGFHSAATGRDSFNLDSWAMPQALINATATTAAGADLVLAEGSMGLFDGVAAAGAWGTGASSEVAAHFRWPVVLVINPAGQAQTAAAVAQGLARFRPGLAVAGVILNRTASPRHEALVRAGIEAVGLRVFGALPRATDIAMPERHLGLVQAEEQTGLQALIRNAAALVAQHIDLDALIAAASGQVPHGPPAAPLAPPGQRIALARDAAFSFVYPHMVAGWRAAGATILPFSPLQDEGPDPTADVCWLPGGYPELHAGRLSAAAGFRTRLQTFAQTRPVHGECGGYMAMGAGLEDAAGQRHRMAGLLGLETSYARRRMHLGYRQATLRSPMPGLAQGHILRGHEFHYARILSQPDAPLADVVDATGTPVAETGSCRGRASGSFFHLIAGA